MENLPDFTGLNRFVALKSDNLPSYTLAVIDIVNRYLLSKSATCDFNYIEVFIVLQTKKITKYLTF